MNDLRQAAQQALAAMDYMLNNGEWYQAQERADALRAALAEPDRAQKLTEAGYTRRPTLREMAEPALNPAPGYCKHCKQYTIEEPLPAEPVDPVAWRYKYSDGFWRFSNGSRVNGCDPIESQALYTSPPQRKPLTEEEILLISVACAASHQQDDVHFARAVEAAHGIK